MRFDIESAILGLRTVAEIAEDPRGGPVRRIINGRQRRPVGRYSSRKAGRALPWESRAERAFFWHCEADPAVVDYLPQPHKLTIKTDGGPDLVYYPDLRRNMSDGRVEIREIKSAASERYAAEPDYALKLDLAREVYEGLGWHFGVLREEDDILRPAVRLETVWAIQRRRHVRVDARDEFALLGAIAREGGEAPLGVAAEALGGGCLGLAKVAASVVRRIASVPLDRRLDDDTPVTAVATGPRHGGCPC